MRRIIALAFLCFLSVAHAQNAVCPTAPNGDDSNRCASTAFVQNAFGGGASLSLTQYHLFIGNSLNKAADTALGGDCTYTTSYGIVCTKTNNTAFGPFATGTDSSNLTNLGSDLSASGGLHIGAFTGDVTKSSASLATTVTAVQGKTYQNTTYSNGQSPVWNSTNNRFEPGSSPQLTFTTRTVAAATNLTGYTVIQTLAYATAGDGGGSIFKNIGTAQPLDSYITGESTTSAGSGCTNGTYDHIVFSGGNGVGAWGYGTVSGGTVTAFTIYGRGGGYKVGDVLSSENNQLGCTNFQITVSSVSTPLASFTDAGGNNWQYSPPGSVYAAAFGVVTDGLSGSPTDNFAALQAANNYAFIDYSPAADWAPGTTQGTYGQNLILPKGNMMFCGSNGAASLEFDGGVTVQGLGNNASVLIPCSTWSTSTQFITLGKYGAGISCLNVRLQNLQILTGLLNGSSGTAAVTSDCVQDAIGGISDVTIYAGNRSCIWLNGAAGGASTVVLERIDCTNIQGSSVTGAVQNAIQINWGGLQVPMDHIVINGDPTSVSSVGIRAANCQCIMTNIHVEEDVTGISIGNPTGGVFNVVDGFTGGPNCTHAIAIDSSVVSNTVRLGNIQNGPCTYAVDNRSVNVTGPILAQTVY